MWLVELDAETKRARRLYIRYRMITEEAWGPFVQFDPTFNERIAPLIKNMTSVFSACRPIKISDVEYSFHSAWHAVLHLLQMQFITCTAPLPKHFVYRGHADSSWPLLSTRTRMTTDDRRVDDLATWLFVGLIRNKIRGISRVVDMSGLCAIARHYGLASHLLDFTGDPAVAVWFACNDSSQTHGNARVLAIDVDSFMRLGGGLIAPPLFERRMANQIAVALDTRRLKTDVLGQNMLSVTFPIPAKEHSFVLYRDSAFIRVLQCSEWLTGLASHCRMHAQDAERPMTHRAFDEMLRQCCEKYPSAPQEFVVLTSEYMIQWSKQFVDWLHWIVIGVNLERTKDFAATEVLLLIIASNPVISGLAADMLEKAAATGVMPGADRIAKIIRSTALDIQPGKYLRRPSEMMVITAEQRKRFLDQIGAKQNIPADPASYLRAGFS